MSFRIAPTDRSLTACGLIRQHVQSSNVAVVTLLDCCFRKKFAKVSLLLVGEQHLIPSNDDDSTTWFTAMTELAPRNDRATRGSGLINSLGSTFKSWAAVATSSRELAETSTNVYPDPVVSIRLTISPSESKRFGGTTTTVLSSTDSSSSFVWLSPYSN